MVNVPSKTLPEGDSMVMTCAPVGSEEMLKVS